MSPVVGLGAAECGYQQIVSCHKEFKGCCRPRKLMPQHSIRYRVADSGPCAVVIGVHANRLSVSGHRRNRHARVRPGAYATPPSIPLPKKRSRWQGRIGRESNGRGRWFIRKPKPIEIAISDRSPMLWSVMQAMPDLVREIVHKHSYATGILEGGKVRTGGVQRVKAIVTCIHPQTFPFRRGHRG